MYRVPNNDSPPPLAQYWKIAETRGLFYWNLHAILVQKHIFNNQYDHQKHLLQQKNDKASNTANFQIFHSHFPNFSEYLSKYQTILRKYRPRCKIQFPNDCRWERSAMVSPEKVMPPFSQKMIFCCIAGQYSENNIFGYSGLLFTKHTN